MISIGLSVNILSFPCLHDSRLVSTFQQDDLPLVHYKEKDICLCWALLWCPLLSATINEIHLRSRARQINPIRFCHSLCVSFSDILSSSSPCSLSLPLSHSHVPLPRFFCFLFTHCSLPSEALQLFTFSDGKPVLCLINESTTPLLCHLWESSKPDCFSIFVCFGGGVVVLCKGQQSDRIAGWCLPDTTWWKQQHISCFPSCLTPLPHPGSSSDGWQAVTSK